MVLCHSPSCVERRPGWSSEPRLHASHAMPGRTVRKRNSLHPDGETWTGLLRWAWLDVGVCFVGRARRGSCWRRCRPKGAPHTAPPGCGALMISICRPSTARPQRGQGGVGCAGSQLSAAGAGHSGGRGVCRITGGGGSVMRRRWLLPCCDAVGSSTRCGGCAVEVAACCGGGGGVSKLWRQLTCCAGGLVCGPTPLSLLHAPLSHWHSMYANNAGRVGVGACVGRVRFAQHHDATRFAGKSRGADVKPSRPSRMPLPLWLPSPSADRPHPLPPSSISSCSPTRWHRRRGPRACWQ